MTGLVLTPQDIIRLKQALPTMPDTQKRRTAENVSP